MSLADNTLSIPNGSSADSSALALNSTPGEIAQNQLVATDNDIAALIADIRGSFEEPTTGRKPEAVELDMEGAPQVSPVGSSLSILGAASRQVEGTNSVPAAEATTLQQPIAAAADPGIPSISAIQSIMQRISGAKTSEPSTPAVAVAPEPSTLQTGPTNLVPQHTGSIVSTKQEQPVHQSPQTQQKVPAAASTPPGLVQSMSEEAIPEGIHPDRRRALELEKQAETGARKEAMITSPVHYVAMEPATIETIRPTLLSLHDPGVDAAKSVLPTNVNVPDQTEVPMQTALILQDKDIQDWLLFTNYYNLPYRTQFLKRRRRLAALELERQKLLEEEDEDAALFGRRQMSNSSASALMTPIATPGTATTAQFTAMPRVSTPLSAQLERTPSTEYFPTTRPVPMKRAYEPTVEEAQTVQDRPAKQARANETSQQAPAAAVYSKRDAPQNQAVPQEMETEPRDKKQKENQRPTGTPQQVPAKKPQAPDTQAKPYNPNTVAVNPNRSLKTTALRGSPPVEAASFKPAPPAKAAPPPLREEARNGSAQQKASHSPSTDRPTSRGRLEDRVRFSRDHDSRERSLSLDLPARPDTYRATENGSLKPRRKASSHGDDTRYFILKSFNSDNIWRCMDDGVWATQPANGPVLTEAFKSSQDVILFFSANKSRAFQGYARMSTAPSSFIPRPPWMENIHWETTSPFRLEWLNTASSSFHHSFHLLNSLNEGRPVSIAKDGQEVEPTCARDLMKVLDKSRAIEDARDARYRH